MGRPAAAYHLALSTFRSRSQEKILLYGKGSPDVPRRRAEDRSGAAMTWVILAAGTAMCVMAALLS
jgi:hypothetical protein